MPLRFTVLASGSAGNATLVQADEFGLLLDVGLGPRQLATRLADVGASWADIHAVILTHTHSDHWNDATLRHLWKRKVPLYCAPEHRKSLEAWSASFALLKIADLLRDFSVGQEVTFDTRLRCLPLPVRHDSGATFGFRFEACADLFGEGCSAAYVADLGCWDASLASSLANVDLLAIEFNHDLALECASSRSPTLIARVLGDEGHLSNDQAAALLRAVLLQSGSGKPSHLVQLHLSRECNRPLLALASARTVIDELSRDVRVHTASQDCVSPTFVLGNGVPERSAPRRRLARRRKEHPAQQSWLPGLEGNEQGASDLA